MGKDNESKKINASWLEHLIVIGILTTTATGVMATLLWLGGLHWKPLPWLMAVPIILAMGLILKPLLNRIRKWTTVGYTERLLSRTNEQRWSIVNGKVVKGEDQK